MATRNSIIEIKPNSVEHKRVLNSRLPAVYIIRCLDKYKIGYTRSQIHSRIEAMRTGNPFPIKLVYAIQTERCQELEEALHEHFKNRREYREWFTLQLEDKQRIDEFVLDFLYGKQINS